MITVYLLPCSVIESMDDFCGIKLTPVLSVCKWQMLWFQLLLFKQWELIFPCCCGFLWWRLSLLKVFPIKISHRGGEKGSPGAVWVTESEQHWFRFWGHKAETWIQRSPSAVCEHLLAPINNSHSEGECLGVLLFHRHLKKRETFLCRKWFCEMLFTDLRLDLSELSSYMCMCLTCTCCVFARGCCYTWWCLSPAHSRNETFSSNATCWFESDIRKKAMESLLNLRLCRSMTSIAMFIFAFSHFRFSGLNNETKI